MTVNECTGDVTPLTIYNPLMKAWIVAFALAGLFAQAQDQSGCPGPRQGIPTDSCGPSDLNRNITVHVARIDTGEGSTSGSSHTTKSSVSWQTLADARARVEDQRYYRACDMEWEIMDLVRESFQHLGYFCAAVEPISALKVGKNEYKIFINVHPGQQYRVAEVKFTGATQLSSDELKSDLHIKPNSLFDGESIRRGIENIQKSYAKKRHWGATAVPVVSVDETDSKVALEIKIQEPD